MKVLNAWYLDLDVVILYTFLLDLKLICNVPRTVENALNITLELLLMQVLCY